MRFLRSRIFLRVTRILFFSYWEVHAAALEPSLFSGRIFSDFYVPTGNPLQTELQQISTSFWLQADPKLGESSSAHLVFTGDNLATSAAYGVTGVGQVQLGLREAHVDYVQSGWEVRLGKMLIPWGKSDGVNPTDFISAKNYSFFNPDEEVKRIGSIGVMLSWTPGGGSSPWTLTGVAIPVFAQSQLLLAPSQIPSYLTISSSNSVPSTSFSNIETALKMAYVGIQWDASLTFYRGLNHLPDFQVQSVTAASSATGFTVEVADTFHPVRALGADASFNTQKWVWRAESSYVWTANDDGSNPLIQPSHWDTVLGVERPLWDDFRGQIQLYGRYFPRYVSPSSATGVTPALALINQQVAATNAMIQNYQDQFRPAFTFRLSYSHDESGLAAEVFAMMNCVGGDYLLKPQMSYLWTDALKTFLGVDYYAGPVDRPLGALAPYSAVYTEAKYVF